MIKTFFTLLCFAGLMYSRAQTVDSIVKRRDLVFKSDEEKRTFFRAEDGVDQYLDLFLSTTGGTTTVNSATALFMINNCVSEIKENVKGKSEEKQVKFIYTYVHKKFFTKYEFKKQLC